MESELTATIVLVKRAKVHFAGRRDAAYTEQQIIDLLVNAANICDLYAVTGTTFRPRGRVVTSPKLSRAAILLRQAASEASYNRATAATMIAEAEKIISARRKRE